MEEWKIHCHVEVIRASERHQINDEMSCTGPRKH